MFVRVNCVCKVGNQSDLTERRERERERERAHMCGARERENALRSWEASTKRKEKRFATWQFTGCACVAAVMRAISMFFPPCNGVYS